jgi:ornithine--oxo-acid transaminase
MRHPHDITGAAQQPAELSTSEKKSSADHIALTERFSAHNYSPLDVVISEGKGVWLTDVEGNRYLDMLSAYSAVTWGHCPERFIKVATKQMNRLTLCSRGFYSDQTGLFCQELAALCGMEVVLPMNTGAEAVETAIKAARKWAYEVKKIPDDTAEIIVFGGNFHGRTTTIISASSSASSKAHFGPLTPGFKMVPYGDAEALRAAITPHTAAVLIEPIQGEAGVLIPPAGYLRAVRELCSAHRVLMLADEIQTGLCRTGKIFACEHEGVQPDVYILGKALGASLFPISAGGGSNEVMSVFTPGTHGSTFGGNPLACAVAREVIAYIRSEHPERRAAELGTYFVEGLRTTPLSKVSEIRGRGLFVGVDVKKELGKAKPFCHALKDLGVLCKDTRESTIRFAPPVVIEKAEIDWALERIRKVLG